MTVKSHRRKLAKKYMILYLMVIPALIGYFLIRYVPVWGVMLAFVDYKVGRPVLSASFAGLKYFKKFFHDISNAQRIFYNTILINICSIIFTYFFGVVFAVCMHESRSRKMTHSSQLITLFPYFLSAVIVYSLVSVFFAQNNGVINTTLRNLGLIDEGVNFLGSSLTRWVMVFSRVWCQAGYYAILFYSTLTSISMDQYEAAELDGAGRWQRIRYISLENLKGTIAVLLVVSVGNILSSSLDQFMLWTNSQNYDSMITFSMYIYNYGLGKGQFSYASAVGLFNAVVSTVLVLIANRISRKVTEASLI